MLTCQQANTLQAIRDYWLRHGRPPTLEEIGSHIGIRSRGSVHRLVQTLLEKNYLQRRGRSFVPTERLAGPSLPLLGRIAAGQPIAAIPGEDQLNLADFLLGPGRYALRVVGDSMIGAGILDGDTVVVRQADTAQDGEIVVALIDEQEATLKRLLRRSDGLLELVAENPAIANQVYPPDRVRIQGVVVGQLRSY